jgi:7-keto-8-aminopelargonate synthetase-like enzyme
LIDFLLNRARSFIFSTAPVPASAAAALEAVRLLECGEGEPLREKLWANIRRLDTSAASAILPRMVGDEAEAVALSESLLDEGFLVPAIRYPTVAKGQARLRVSISAAHSAEQVESLKSAL